MDNLENKNPNLNNQISVPFSIDGEEFVLEIGDIKSIDVIDLNLINNDVSKVF